MEKRVFLAILLSFVVLAVYQVLVPQSKPVPVPVTQTTTATPGTMGATSAPVAATPPAPDQTPAAAALVADTSARDIVVETDVVRAVFSTKGATLKSWKLKKYLENGEPLDFVPSDLPEALPRGFAMSTADPALSRTLATALFKPSADSLTLGSAPGQLTFEYRDASGLTARKTFYFQPEQKPYVLKVEAAIDLGGASKPVTLASGPALGLGYQPDGSRHVPVGAALYVDGKAQHLTVSSLQKQGHYEGEMKFVGVADQYFLNAALPGTQRVAVDYEPISLPVPGTTSNALREFTNYRIAVPGSMAMPFFLGPKDFDILRDVDPRLDLVYTIDFGMFRVIVVPLLTSLKWINSYIGNYGWSIVVLTIIINLLIFPLRHRSMVSMKKMQSVQPEVKAIQDRFAKYKLTDPERQKMNQEMMALYKQKGVNPASGCVPMLLTLPVLFAFYAMLYGAIELRGAPFMGWIHDLSRHDPFYITPILMGLSMLWQQKMMPTTADPIQQKMFLLMPVIFTVSFLWAPAGLVVYWFSSNLLAIGQQYLTNRMIAAPARSSSSPKRVGSGSTKS
ncbi:MAG: membrane protein insertase YidC [Acidobacteriota bacterium]